MKAYLKKRRLIPVIAVLALLLFGIIGYCLHEANRRLSEEEITVLRETYPLCGNLSGLDMRYATMAEEIEHNDTFVYGTVEGESSTYVKSVLNGERQPEGTRPNGSAFLYEYYSYTVSVIEDSEGIYQGGEKIQIEAPMSFVDFNPRLSDGMKIVVPILLDSESETLTYFGAMGMYYVTEDGYVLSVVDEALMEMEEPLTGVKLEKLLEKVKKENFPQ